MQRNCEVITEDLYLQHSAQSATRGSPSCQEPLARLSGRCSPRGRFQRDVLGSREPPAPLLQPRAAQARDRCCCLRAGSWLRTLGHQVPPAKLPRPSLCSSWVAFKENI